MLAESKGFTSHEGEASDATLPVEVLPPGPRLVTTDGLARFRREYEVLPAGAFPGS